MADFDAWDGKTPEELKKDCRRLSRALFRWQQIAMCVSTPERIKTLPKEWREEIETLIAAYADDDEPDHATHSGGAG